MIDFYLRVFLTTAKTCSFTKAAELLNITQPAVTNQIKNLENTLKTKLFTRKQNRICLTHSGEILLRYADEIGQLYRQAKDEISLLSGHVFGDVSFGSTSLLGTYLLPLIIGEYKQSHPDVNLSMHVGNSKDVLRMLLDGIIELAIVSGPIHSKSLTIIPFYRDQLRVIVPPDHPWCRLETIAPERLFEENFILREQGSNTRDFVTKTLEQFSRSREIRTAMVFGNTEAIKQGVRGKVGISIVSRLASKLEVEKGLLREVSIQNFDLKRDFFIVYRTEQEISVQTAHWKNYLLKQRDKNFPLT